MQTLKLRTGDAIVTITTPHTLNVKHIVRKLMLDVEHNNFQLEYVDKESNI